MIECGFVGCSDTRRQADAVLFRASVKPFFVDIENKKSDLVILSCIGLFSLIGIGSLMALGECLHNYSENNDPERLGVVIHSNF